jgi:hypothetical protein
MMFASNAAFMRNQETLDAALTSLRQGAKRSDGMDSHMAANTPTILHIDASSRREGSLSRRFSQDVVDTLVAGAPDATIIRRDLAATSLPYVDDAWIAANFTDPEQRNAEQAEALSISDRLVDELKAADTVVIGVPVRPMGLLVDGVWHDTWYDTKKSGGKFVRQSARSSAIGLPPTAAPGRPGDGGFKAEAGRYHLYVSLACPWAHRTLIFRKLKGLEDMISVDVVSPLMYDKGWVFDADQPDAPPIACSAPTCRRHLCEGRSEILGPRHGADPLGQADQHHRLQRILGDHPHVQPGF